MLDLCNAEMAENVPVLFRLVPLFIFVAICRNEYVSYPELLIEKELVNA